MESFLTSFFIIPIFYFPAILNPFYDFYYSFLPATGVLAFILGVGFSFAAKNHKVWLYATSVFLTHAFIVATFYKQIPLGTNWPHVMFFVLQLFLIIGVSIFLKKKGNKATKIASNLLMYFTANYAVFLWYMSTMLLQVFKS